MGLEFPVLWGLIAFLLNFIPAIGSIVAAIPPALFALIQFGWLQMSFVLLGYLVINMLLGNFIEPMLMGYRFGISTTVVILSVVFWGWLWGSVGMFLAVPLTMMIKVMLDNTEEFRWLSVAMSKEAGSAGNQWFRPRRRARRNVPRTRRPGQGHSPHPPPSSQPPAPAPGSGAPNR
jgi:predicted PurR-regulated permease PerM